VRHSVGKSDKHTYLLLLLLLLLLLVQRFLKEISTFTDTDKFWKEVTTCNFIQTFHSIL